MARIDANQLFRKRFVSTPILPLSQGSTGTLPEVNASGFDYLNSPLSASAFDALGPAHQNAKHGHDKQSQDYYKENFTERALQQRCHYLDYFPLSSIRKRP